MLWIQLQYNSCTMPLFLSFCGLSPSPLESSFDGRDVFIFLSFKIHQLIPIDVTTRYKKIFLKNLRIKMIDFKVFLAFCHLLGDKMIICHNINFPMHLKNLHDITSIDNAVIIFTFNFRQIPKNFGQKNVLLHTKEERITGQAAYIMITTMSKEKIMMNDRHYK